MSALISWEVYNKAFIQWNNGVKQQQIPSVKCQFARDVCNKAFRLKCPLVTHVHLHNGCVHITDECH